MKFIRLGLLVVLGLFSARAATETYTTQTANINQTRTERNNNPPYAGTYDNGAELAQYANGGSFGNTPGAAAFRTFTINGNDETASARTFQHGDRFSITAYIGGNPSSGGRVGISFRDSTDYADFFKSTEAGTTEGRFQLDSSGGWKVYGNGGSYDSGSGAAADRTFTITVTSENTFNATVAGTSYYDLDMDASGGTIDSFAIYTFGDGNQNSFWKSASLQDTGTLEFGGSNATKVITGGIFDGLAANSTSAVRTNEVLKTGSGTITFNGTNTYGGGTQIRAGTLAIRRDSGLGAVPAAAVTNLILTNNASALATTNNFTIEANRVILLAGPAGNSYFWGVASASTSTYGGNLTGPGHLVKNQDGTLVLTNGKTATGGLYIDRGAVLLSGGTLAGNAIDLGTAGSDTASAAELWAGIDVTNTITVNTGSGRRLLQGAGGSQRTLSGGLTLNNSLVIDGGTDVRIVSVIAGTGRVNKTGSGRLTVTANNTFSGGMGLSNGTFVANSGTGSAGGSGVVRVVAPAVVTGTGIVSKLSIADGGLLAPGASPGTLTVGDTTFDTNGVYVWEINNFTGTQGGDPGWDWLRSTGTLTIASTVANTFTVRVTSLNFENTGGIASNFDAAVGFTQYIASAVSISGFAANKFALDLSAFSNAYTGGFTIQQIASTNLAIVYAPPTPPGLAAGPASLAFTAMLGDLTVAAQQIGVTNVGGSALIATNFVTYGTGSGWLTVTPSSFTLAVAATRTVTASVNAAGFAAGTYYATNRLDGNQSNAAHLVSVTLTVTNIPAPQSVSAVASGPQLVRLNSAESGGRQILIVHRQGSAPSADPANGTAYSPGDALGGGTVIFKGAAGFLEHVVAADAAQHYRFYAINNTNYSAAVDASATTPAFWPNVKIDQSSYTQTVALAGLNGGQGWAGAWAVTNKGSGGFTIETNGSTATFAQMPAYPTNFGNRIRMTDQGTGGSTGEAWRTFASISTGRIYAAYQVAYQFNGPDKFAGMAFVSNASERVFFGERPGADKQLGIRYGATEVGSSYGLNDYNADNGNTYLVIASYDFTSRVFRTKAYYRTVTVALAEPTGWDVETTLPAGTMDAVNGVVLRAGAPSGGTVGQVFFDEIRVAQSWADLMGAVAPVLSAYSVNAGADVTDGQIASGSYGVAMQFYDPAGLSNNAATPNFDVLNAAGTQILTDRTFAASTSFDSGRVVAGTNATQGAVAAAGIDLGTYALRWSAVNSNGIATANATTQSNGTTLAFTVVDDDTSAPALSGFVATGTGAGTVTVLQVKNGGWSLTGLVQDAGSGINSNGATISDAAGNISPYFEVLNSTGTVIISSQLFTTVPADGSAQGAAAPLGIATITNTVPLASLPIGVYTVRVTVADNDEDRIANSERTVLTAGLACTFEVIGAPVLDVSPVTLSFASSVGIDPAPAAQTFTVTNAGTAVLGYSNVVSYSANGSGWLSVAAVTGELATGSAQVHTATVSSVALGRGTYYATNTVYGGEGGTQALVVTLSVTSRPYIASGPATLTYHVMLGSVSSNQTFGITNAGDGVLAFTNEIVYGAGSGWLTVAPTSGALAGGVSQVHTAGVSAVSISAAGSYVATNFIVSAAGTNSPQSVVVTAVVTNIPDPQSVSATADGNELVRLTVAEGAGRQVLVVHRAGAAPSADPVNGNTYALGDPIGGGTVAFKLTGAATATNLEHVVAAGTTNHYRFYAINGTAYSPGVSASATVGSYDGASYVEAFAYTNGTSLAGRNGGSGWASAWSVTGGSLTTRLNQGSAGVPLFQSMPNYPAFAANRLQAGVYSSGSEWKARRDFPQISTGKLYAAYVVAVRYKGAGKYTGLRLVSNGVERVFFGETGGDNILGIDGWGGTQQNSAFALNAYDDGVGTDTGNVYLVLGRYDFATRVFDTKAYYRTATVPKTEPLTWDTSVTLAAGRADAINGIELVTAGFSGGFPGDVLFDEVRIAQSWGRLLGFTEPVATNYAFNTNNLVSDQQLNSGSFGAAFDFYDAAGVTNSAFTPNVDVLSPGGVQVITDRVLTVTSHSDAGRSLQASVLSMPAVDAAAVTLGVHTGRWSVYNSNEVGTINSVTLSNGTAVTFTVYDDDTNAPVFGTAIDGRAMGFRIGATNYGSGAGTNGLFVVTDGDLAQVGAANPMQFAFNLHDEGSGLQRSNAGASATNFNFDIGASGVTNVFATYSNGLSSVAATAATATSVFYHAIAFTVGGSGATETGEVWKMIQAATNAVTVSAYDTDADRSGDNLNVIDRQAGLFVVTDDDTNAPVAELLYVGTNYTFGATNGLAVTDADIAAGGRVDIAYRWHDPSGLFVTNNDVTKTNAFSNQGNVTMNWDLTNSLGQAFGSDILHSPADMHGDNGDAYVTNVLLNIGAASNVSLSAWYLTVSAQDLDSDRGTYNPGGAQAGTSVSYDRAVRTNQLMSFSVVDDDVTGPTAPTQSVVVLRGHEWTNSLDVMIQWSSNGVEDVSGISGFRVWTNEAASSTSGAAAGSGTSFTWTVTSAEEGIRTNHLFAIDNDADRTNDYMYGASVTFTTRLDRTPPARVTNVVATIAGVADDSSEIRLLWTSLTNAGSRADGEPLSPWKSYVIFYTTDGSAPSTNASRVWVDNGRPELGTNTIAELILSNLNYDTEFRFALSGLDVAGNYGDLSTVVTQRTGGFIVTQGLVTAASGVITRWTLRPNLAYDVLYQDATSWSDLLTNGWKLLATVTNSFPEDTGTVTRTAPQNLVSTMRFYRVAGTDVWQTNNSIRRASREIYVAKTLALVPGENWVSLFFEPDNNRIADVLGTNRLPGGATIATATKVSWYAAASSAVATNVLWLSSSGNWIYSVGGAGVADDKALPLVEGFNIEIPGSSTQRLTLVGSITTNVRVHTVGAGAASPNETYHLRSLQIPRRTTLAETGLKNAGLVAGINPTVADEIRVLSNAGGVGSKVAPAYRLWLRSTDNTWRYTPGNASAEGHVFEPGQTLILVRRNAGTVTVTNALNYTIPGKNINP